MEIRIAFFLIPCFLLLREQVKIFLIIVQQNGDPVFDTCKTRSKRANGNKIFGFFLKNIFNFEMLFCFATLWRKQIIVYFINQLA